MASAPARRASRLHLGLGTLDATPQQTSGCSTPCSAATSLPEISTNPGPCFGKTAMDAATARKVAKRMARTKDTPHLQAYRCDLCGLWHVGGSPRRWYPKGKPIVKRP